VRKRIRQGGALLVIVSVMLMVAERATGRFSDWLGHWICGPRFMEPVDGVVGDHSCGFNADMTLMTVLGGVFLLGILLYIGVGEKQ